MALKKNIIVKTLVGDIQVHDAYIKVDEITANKNYGTATVAFRKDTDGQLFESRRIDFPVDLDGENFIKQTYDYIKTLPEFADAVDC